MGNLSGKGFPARPLHFIWIVDCSTAMAESKMQAVNTAIRSTIELLQSEVEASPHMELLMRAIKFSSGAQWHITEPTPIAKLRWADLQAGGVTDMGKALKMVAEQLTIKQMPDRALPPVLVLISDGYPTDDFKSGLNALMEQPWGKEAIRLAITFGGDSDLDILQQFIGYDEIKPLQIQSYNSDIIFRYIKMALTWTSGSYRGLRKSEDHSALETNLQIPLPQFSESEIDIDEGENIW